jgi:hypothetical protein
MTTTPKASRAGDLTWFGGLKWYEYLPNRDHIELWARSLAPGRISTLRWDLEQDTAWFNPTYRSIGINPSAVGKTPREQWRGTRAMTAHECGHANFTGESLGEGDALHQVSNILEDQRIEWLMTNAFPNLGNEFRYLHRWFWNKAEPTKTDDDPQHVLAAALLHRWERWLGIKPSKRKRKSASKTLVSKISLSEENEKRWKTVRPWVEESWVASSSDDVVAIAKRILEFLKIPEKTKLPDWLKKLLESDGISVGTAVPLPGVPHDPSKSKDSAGEGESSESDDDGLRGHADGGRDLVSGHTRPSPNYAEYVDAVMPWVRQLAARMERPTPRVRIVPTDTRGRYSVRAEQRDAERPLLWRDAPGIAPGLAIDILGDQSGSMGMSLNLADDEPKMNAARLGVMLIHLACAERRIAHAITLFDEHFSVLEYGGDNEIASALIAGWNGWTCSEHLGKHMRERAPKLLARPEKCRVMIVTHDGYPVAPGDPEDVVDFQKEYAGRIHVIGVYLHDGKKVDVDEETQMRRLFPNLISASPNELPNKLGDLMAALA